MSKRSLSRYTGTQDEVLLEDLLADEVGASSYEGDFDQTPNASARTESTEVIMAIIPTTSERGVVGGMHFEFFSAYGSRRGFSWDCELR